MLATRPALRMLAVAIALPCAACGAESAGVHVTVTLDDDDAAAWQGALFDHVTVTAEAGDVRAVACLFPPFELEQAVEGDSRREDPCADAHVAPWTRLPDVTSWALSDQPRTINFVLPQQGEVRVSAVARLGGGDQVATARALVQADEDYPSVTLRLASVGRDPPADCDVRLEEAVPENLVPIVFPADALCEGGAGSAAACPITAEVASHSPGVFCVGDRLRFYNPTGTTCAGEPPEVAEFDDVVVLTVGAAPPGETAALKGRMYMVGHFVRCIDGDPRDPAGCRLTTECAPPATAISTYLGSDLSLNSTHELSCLPPMSVPAVFSFRVDVPEDLFLLMITQEPKEVDAADSCFLDVVRAGIVRDPP